MHTMYIVAHQAKRLLISCNVRISPRFCTSLQFCASLVSSHIFTTSSNKSFVTFNIIYPFGSFSTFFINAYINIMGDMCSSNNWLTTMNRRIDVLFGSTYIHICSRKKWLKCYKKSAENISILSGQILVLLQNGDGPHFEGDHAVSANCSVKFSPRISTRARSPWGKNLI